MLSSTMSKVSSSVSCRQRAGDAAVYGAEQPSTVPDDLRQDDDSEAVGKAQQTEEPHGDEPGRAAEQTGRGVERLDRTLQVRTEDEDEDGGRGKLEEHEQKC